MSDYAKLKARLDRWKLVWGDLPSIAAAIRALKGKSHE